MLVSWLKGENRTTVTAYSNRLLDQVVFIPDQLALEFRRLFFGIFDRVFHPLDLDFRV
jgi:hypothetical protein